MDKPLLSVIVPVFNGASFLLEAIASIRPSLEPLEIVVIDDGSTDGTGQLARNCPGLRYVRQQNAGPAAARNRGLKMASGNLIAFLDADDIWAEGHPASGLEYLRRHPAVDLVLGQVQYRFDSKGPDFENPREPFHSYQLGAAIARRELFDQIGDFNPSMHHGEDIDWFLRARESGAVIATLPETALYYRLHAANQPKIYRDSRKGLLDAFHRSLVRRRDQATAPTGSRIPPNLISIVIPVYNGEEFIAEAIQSALAQDYRPIEVIVVDDGSTDRTRDMVRKFPAVTLVEQSHRGAGAARNAGVRASTAQFIAFLDADDLWIPEKLSRQIERLTSDDDMEAVFGHVIQFHDQRPGESEAMSSPIPGTMLIRRAAFDRIGFFSEELTELEGVDWLLRAKEKNLRTITLSDVVYRRRIHARNRGIANRDFDGYIRVLKASLDRRRAIGNAESYHVR